MRLDHPIAILLCLTLQLVNAKARLGGRRAMSQVGHLASSWNNDIDSGKDLADQLLLKFLEVYFQQA